MVAQVCLGQVGAVAAREVSRFARNSREWQQLVEVCRVVDTVLIDQETVYAPRQSNDRLLLGLKGSLNEYELDLLRHRPLEARREMAKRGELIVSAPVGYIKSEETSFEKTPDRRVREAVELLFEKVVEIGSVSQTLLWFQEQGLQFPAHTAKSEVQWKRPSYGCFHRLLTNPSYGGVYAYGKSGPADACDGQLPRPGYRRKPREQWLSFISNAHEGAFFTPSEVNPMCGLSNNTLLFALYRLGYHGRPRPMTTSNADPGASMRPWLNTTDDASRQKRYYHNDLAWYSRAVPLRDTLGTSRALPGALKS